ncbi:hypothetical protein GCM10007989_07760 [Devosia pacifica]|uniref:Uncharacterized protein n=1 Tax=Devosia pacifica TaxID=1335967 RepID=A0A918RXS6_9HYPH|nr:hypothetical protein [Devosia pacifica]GHA15435.1 hypothetical protein GCM10007989_07760 [Devosia pacifica]
MNPLHDDMPNIPACPHCGHDGDGLEWAFAITERRFTRVQCACLACGAHGPERESYAQAVEAFKAGEKEQAA